MFRGVLHNESLFRKIRIVGNRTRFRILELTQEAPKTVTELSKETNLAYNKCADYVSMLEKEGLVKKNRIGRETQVNATFSIKKIKFT